MSDKVRAMVKRADRAKRSSSIVFHLGVLLLLMGTAWLAWWTSEAARRSLQMDYAALYTAGESLNHDLSPYVNHGASQTPIWDGISQYKHSRFLYPPLVAEFFRPFAWWSYHVSKWVWTSLIVLAFIAALSLTAIAIRPAPRSIWLAGAIPLFGFPLIALIERGQIDSITGLFIACAMLLSLRPSGRHILAGVLLAIATALKLHVVYVVIMLLPLRNWRLMAGYVMGGMVLLTISLFLGEPATLANYLKNEFPRISRHGEGGPPEMLLYAPAPAPGDWTAKHGRSYLRELIAFETNATAIRQLDFLLRRFPLSQSALSVCVLLSAGLACMGLLRRPDNLKQATSDSLSIVTYWYLAMSVTLLAAPLTWTMNLVWIAPFPMVLAAWWHRRTNDRAVVGWIIVGLIGSLFVLTRPINVPLGTHPWIGRLIRLHYVYGEGLTAAACVGLLRRRQSADSSPDGASLPRTHPGEPGYPSSTSVSRTTSSMVVTPS